MQPILEVKIILIVTMEHKIIRTWKSNGLSDQFLNSFGTVRDVLLSKAIKPMHLIFNDGGFFIQQRKMP